MSIGLIAGVDEAGRGPLAGRVYAAAVILSPDKVCAGIRDSKQLSAMKRERLIDEIHKNSVATAVAWADVDEIDRLNILNASLLAMRRAVLALQPAPARVRVDGIHCPDLPMPVEAIVRGDASITEIAAASILAKVARDQYMCELADRYPEYGFARNKGYPTRAHVEALSRYGVSPVHRRSFGPVARCLK